jgi:hypothetical protein
MAFGFFKLKANPFDMELGHGRGREKVASGSLADAPKPLASIVHPAPGSNVLYFFEILSSS